MRRINNLRFRESCHESDFQFVHGRRVEMILPAAWNTWRSRRVLNFCPSCDSCTCFRYSLCALSYSAWLTFAWKQNAIMASLKPHHRFRNGRLRNVACIIAAGQLQRTYTVRIKSNYRKRVLASWNFYG